MMRQLWIIILMLFAFTPVFAQETSEGWEVTQHCVGELPYPTIPQDEWTFDGVIFTQDAEGIHALRIDAPSPYFVAFENAENFSSVGDFSPDGRWFAYPTGTTDFYVNMVGDSFFSPNAIQVVSTDPQHITYRIDWDMYGHIGSRPSSVLTSLHWIDNEHILADGQIEAGGGIINAFTGEIKPWANENISLYYLWNFSPDFTRAFFREGDRFSRSRRLYDLENESFLNDFDNLNYILWKPDSSGYITSIFNDPDPNQISLFDREGQFVDTLMTDTRITTAAFSHDSQRIIFLAEQHFYLADLDNRIITDLCVETYFAPYFAWSPDDTSVIFLHDRYPVLLNLETLDMQILQYQTDQILGWYPLEQ